ncbi:MAG: clostripain-related cysteine peptidase [Clostridia bacterium]|nr:clostripain-related cysteine peptidase [Clostridia bacterium]
MAENRPRGRERNNQGESGGVNRRGSGLGQGPVGNGGNNGRPGTGGSGSGGPNRSSGGGGGILASLLSGRINKTTVIILILAVIVFFILVKTGRCSVDDVIPGNGLSEFVPSGVSGGWVLPNNNQKLNANTDPDAREKYTVIKNDGSDKVTVMVYMCGTDLESKGGMASADLGEMCAATLSENVEIIVYTGGCTKWKTTAISNTSNQIWKIGKGKITCLEDKFANASMTAPSTLSDFIKYTSKNYPSNRNILIFWDHGGGALSGFGYDERFEKTGSMPLSGINTALKNAGIKFDIIGFDACLMATAENALMLSDYADYLVASEETEPGLGWYYTNWLTALSANPSMPSVEIGKAIADDFTLTCASKLDGAKTTLSVIDLAEFSHTFPAVLKNFAKSTTELINSDSFKEVSDARSGTREFSASSKIDMVDLVHFAKNIDTPEAKALYTAVLSSVKYNRTSGDMTNSYGVSIYFPLRKIGQVDNAVNAYSAIGMDSEYSKCIKTFAGMEVTGQLSSGGASSPLTSLLGGSQSSSDSTTGSALSGLLGSFINGSSGISVSGLSSSAASFLDILDINRASGYVSSHNLSASEFVFTKKAGKNVISLPDEKWSLVSGIELNLFVDDGTGFIDMGLDNIFEITDDGDLLCEYDGLWLAVNGQPVAYYHTGTVDDGKSYTIHGRIPVLYNGDRANLDVVFTDENSHGKITGLTRDYKDGETDTIAKSISVSEFEIGATIDFVADYYGYNGTYLDSFKIGEQLVYDGTLRLSDVSVVGKTSACYRITDIYGQNFWTPEMK